MDCEVGESWSWMLGKVKVNALEESWAVEIEGWAWIDAYALASKKK